MDLPAPDLHGAVKGLSSTSKNSQFRRVGRQIRVKKMEFEEVGQGGDRVVGARVHPLPGSDSSTSKDTRTLCDRNTPIKKEQISDNASSCLATECMS